MRQKSVGSKAAADKLIKNIRRKTTRHYSAQQKNQLALAGLQGEESTAALCRREGIAESLYDKCSKTFLEAGKCQLSGDTTRQATAPEVKELLCIPRTTYHRWCDLYLEGGLDGLSDKPSRPGSVWNRIPDTRRDDLIVFAREHEALSTCELAVKYTDEKRYLVLNHLLTAF